MPVLYYKKLDGTVVPIGGSPAPTAWTAVPVVPPASIYGAPFQVPQYRKIGDVVYLRGLLGLTGTVAVNTVLFTLPVGFRPPVNLAFPVAGYIAGADTVLQCRIYANGTFFPGVPNTSVYLFLDGVFFSTSVS